MEEQGRMYLRQKYYCHMCRKQCRDENGFKCHKTSESHKRNMHLFMEDPDSYVEQFSEEFEAEFLNVLEARFPTQLVPAAKVHGLTMGARRQIHLNSTKWESLRDFLTVSATQYLEGNGSILIEESETGPLIQMKHSKVPKVSQPVEAKADDDSAMINRVMKIASAATLRTATEPIEPTAVDTSAGPISMTVQEKPAQRVLVSAIDDTEAPIAESTTGEKTTPMDYISQDSGMKRRREESAADSRFLPGIIVKVVDRLSPFFSQKGEVLHATLEGAAVQMRKQVELFTTRQLQNVVPNVGGTVTFVVGQYKGMRGKVTEIRVKEGVVDVSMRGGLVRNVGFADICKCEEID